MAERRTATEVAPTGARLRERLHAGVFEAPRIVPARRHQHDLHICPSCDSHLVYPIDWSPAPARRWTVDLRCPDCEWSGGGTYDQRVVDRFDEQLDLGTEALLEDLGLIARANMEEHVETFVAALHSGAILPEDF
jgi:hypothetical protein